MVGARRHFDCTACGHGQRMLDVARMSNHHRFRASRANWAPAGTGGTLVLAGRLMEGSHADVCSVRTPEAG